MKYFDALPKILTSDNNNNVIILTNLLSRASIISSLLTDPLLFYSYDIQEGDTPEIVAHKYYDDSYRYWIVLMANQLLDPQWDWPLSGNNFNNYIMDKYPTIDPYGTIHHYEKIITQLDVTTNITTTNKVIIDLNGYNNTVTGTQTVTLPTGTVVITTSKNAVSLYNYELGLNESKRTIQLLNKTYVPNFESQFKKLMK